ncbi:aminotransferase class I/II-fold pyridoxal phosphate-dependent enzyme [Acidothermaceae bacterium B102]|nr:aminotransferase class I/II-fold pyridoxal phosphate-dependent enzyme [Acidothermaceae bacterium B102]
MLTAADLLALIPQDTAIDVYGSGGVVEELEGEVAALLGKPAAIFLPSGTMAQQTVLRIHADRRTSRTVLFHPTCHVDEHEGKGYERLHGLVGRPIGDRQRLITLDDLQSVAEPFAALLIELPQREIGGSQPTWAELVAQTTWARARGAAVHLDGARLWESAAGYGVSPAEVAALFDTAYVSFYKGLGGITGCCVVGEADVVAEVAEWRQRHGGTLYALWPYAAAALTALRQRLPLMPRYLEHARDIAALLREVPGITVRPDPPQVPMMHLLVRAPVGTLTANIRRVAEQQGIWTWRAPMATTDPGVQAFELSVGDATLELTPDEVRDVVASLLEEPA